MISIEEVQGWSNQELNIKLAGALGYKVEHHEPLDDNGQDDEYFKLLNPDGSYVLTATSENWYNGERETEEEAWLDVPDFCTDFSALDYVKNVALGKDATKFALNIVKQCNIGRSLQSGNRLLATAAYLALTEE